ncbi:hypothetical protein PP182_12170 [Maribacter sp. PR1]|uniref:Tetratricopeptide repeat protein n=1 Tax=Maribacter cobaltidurans TaxID=1178778 RepID=A0ABU7IV65_9FLAO|nr:MULTISPECIES: tetratricopeptide repeat protein [Maribacter]MDC6389443.1 hypothetical protein [Maribacter sp. PR1]MEE1976832.1 hypothetical protein [Maribacter cobaltidurans]
MKKLLPYLTVLFLSLQLWGQPNCEAFKYNGDLVKYEACKKAMEIRGHYQFSKEYQSILDEAIAIDPTFDYPYWAKSIAYLKSGDFLTWKTLIDKAVELNPKERLGYRGWCRYQFFRDYQGAIGDIERLDSMVDYDIGQSQNGTYHLNIAKALCYKALGQMEKAIKIMEDQIAKNEAEDFVGPNDYVHLGVMYSQTAQWEKALRIFEKQAQVNDLAENHYYSALTLRELGKAEPSLDRLKTAKELYLAGRRMSDPYSNPMDKIYFEDIETAINSF